MTHYKVLNLATSVKDYIWLATPIATLELICMMK